MPVFATEQISLYYEQFGARADPPVLLIHGFTCQCVHWPRTLIDGICAAGYRVVTYDLRDCGRSTRLDHRPVGTVESIMAAPGATPAPYGLAELADDARRLLDHLGQSGAHLIGFSLGGMIAQQLALSAPTRVFSLTSIGSSTSDRDLPRGDRAAFDAFVSTPPDEPAAAIAHLIDAWRVLGGEHYDSRRLGMGRMVEEAYQHGYSAAGAARQLLAILGAPERGAALESLEIPALVVHGAIDPMVPLAAGQRTAERLPQAHLEVIDDMGHDLPEPLLERIVTAIVRHLDAVPEQR